MRRIAEKCKKYKVKFQLTDIKHAEETSNREAERNNFLNESMARG